MEKKTSGKEIKSILFICAMEIEGMGIVQALDLKEDPAFQPPFVKAYKGSYAKKNILLVFGKKDPKYKVDSIGSEFAGLLTYIGISACNPDLVINAGTAGGYGKGLKIGDICIGKGDPIFFNRAIIVPEYTGYVTGQYPTVQFPKMEEKLKLKSGLIGSTESWVIDEIKICQSKNVDLCEMEAAGISKVCFLMNKPFYAVKVVSDVPAESKSEVVEMFFDMLTRVTNILGEKMKEILTELDYLP